MGARFLDSCIRKTAAPALGRPTDTLTLYGARRVGEGALFTPSGERAALAGGPFVTDAVTRITEGHLPDAVFGAHEPGGNFNDSR